MLSLSVNAQRYNTEIVAKITLEQKYNAISITGTSTNLTSLNQSLRYELTVFKGDKENTNKSKNSQSGRFVLEPGQRKDLSVTSINSDENERIIILLLVYNSEDILLGKDRIVLNDDENATGDKIILKKKIDTLSNSKDKQFENADGLVLRGIVVEETKTKLGSDFYKMFYLTYLNEEINGREIVTVKEVLAVGNNTKIEIYAGRNLIAEFFVRPQNDYLVEMRNQSIIRIRAYFINLEKNVSRVKSY